MKFLLAVFAAPLILLTLLLAPPMALADECETIIVTTPTDNSKLRCEVCGGVTMRCFPI